MSTEAGEVHPSDSIEHIWAKSSAAEKQKHRLGNLVLLSPTWNSKLGAKPAKTKTEAYRKTGVLVAGRVANAIDESGVWKKQQIDDREDELAEWATTEWAS
jgi:hypothetical protein